MKQAIIALLLIPLACLAQTKTLNIDSTGKLVFPPTSNKSLTFESGSKLILGGEFKGPSPVGLAHGIDSRLPGKNPATDRAIYSSATHTGTPAYVRNVNCWAADIDLTSISVWNSHIGTQGAGTLISPRHIIFAEHFMGASGSFPVPNGTTFRWVTKNNQIVERTITSKARVGATDICIGVLSSDVPNTLNFVRTLPASWVNFAEGSVIIPVLATDQEAKAHVFQTSTINGAYQTAIDANRLAFTETPVGGDSGNPVLAIIGSQPVILGVVYSVSGFNDLVLVNLTAINSVMTSLGGSYQLTPIDAAPFTSEREIFGKSIRLGNITSPNTSVASATSDISPVFELFQGGDNSALRITANGAVMPVLEVVGFNGILTSFVNDATPVMQVGIDGSLSWPSNFPGAKATRENVGTVLKYKSGDTTRTSNTTPTADPDLQFPMAANEVWLVKLTVYFSVESATPGFKGGPNGPASPSAMRWGLHRWINEASVLGNFASTAYNTGVNFTANPADVHRLSLQGTFFNGANAGNFTFSWSQDVSSVDDTTVLKGSVLEATRLN